MKRTTTPFRRRYMDSSCTRTAEWDCSRCVPALFPILLALFPLARHAHARHPFLPFFSPRYRRSLTLSLFSVEYIARQCLNPLILSRHRLSTHALPNLALHAVLAHTAAAAPISAPIAPVSAATSPSASTPTGPPRVLPHWPMALASTKMCTSPRLEFAIVSTPSAPPSAPPAST